MEQLPKNSDVIWDRSVQNVQTTVGQIKGYLDKTFGSGFSEKNPEAFSQVVQSVAIEFGAAMIAAAIQDSKK